MPGDEIPEFVFGSSGILGPETTEPGGVLTIRTEVEAVSR